MKSPSPLKRLFILVVVSFVLMQGGALALTTDQKRVIQSGVLYFNVEDDLVSCTGGLELAGSDNAEKIWNFFIGKGLQPHQVAGIMGNMQAESGFEPRLVQYGKLNTRGEISVAGQPSSLDDTPPSGSTTGYGIVQFTPGTKILPSSQRLSLAPGDLGFQLTVLWEQLNGEGDPSLSEKPAGDHLKQTTTVEEATISFETRYERHAPDPRQAGIRIGFAQDAMTRFGSGSAGSGSTGGVSCGGSGQLVGGYSLPLDRQVYDQHPEYFTKPHHDYPAADIPVPVGTNVYSMTAGTVISAPTNGSCGVGVSIRAPNGVVFSYCHGSDGGTVTGARMGDEVTAGQLIMHSASTGNSSGPHLHLGIKVNDVSVCPQTLFVGIAEGNPPDVTSLPAGGCTN